MRGHRYALSRNIDYRCLPGRPYRYIYSTADGDQAPQRTGTGSGGYTDYGTDQGPGASGDESSGPADAFARG